MNTSLALLIVGTLSLGAVHAEVRTVETVEAAEERVRTLVDAILGFDREQNSVMIMIARDGFKREITNVVSAVGNRRLLMIDYVNSTDNKTYQAAVDVSDVLLIEERPK